MHKTDILQRFQMQLAISQLQSFLVHVHQRPQAQWNMRKETMQIESTFYSLSCFLQKYISSFTYISSYEAEFLRYFIVSHF